VVVRFTVLVVRVTTRLVDLPRIPPRLCHTHLRGFGRYLPRSTCLASATAPPLRTRPAVRSPLPFFVVASLLCSLSAYATTGLQVYVGRWFSLPRCAVINEHRLATACWLQRYVVSPGREPSVPRIRLHRRYQNGSSAVMTLQKKTWTAAHTAISCSSSLYCAGLVNITRWTAWQSCCSSGGCILLFPPIGVDQSGCALFE